MNTIFGFAIAGMIVLALIGMTGRRKPVGSLSEWTVGQRNFGALTMWFLQAGEVFTTFTFLAVAGLAFTAGSAATYAIPYIPLAYISLYFVGPVIWRYGKLRNYHTQADFFSDRYQSPALGKVVAFTGVVFLLPYLQLQITGLGLIVQLVTGDAASGTISMIVATVLTVVFVLWAGINGLARISYAKDALMLGAMAVMLAFIPSHYASSIGNMFGKVAATSPQMLMVSSGVYDHTWWISSILISMISVAFMTTPHLWSPLLAAKNAQTIRTNNVFLPVYQVVIIIPVFIGFTAILVLPKTTASNGVLLTLVRNAFPGWATGLIAVAAASAAMIPAAALCIGISGLVSHNLVIGKTGQAKLRINHLTVVTAATLALVLGLTRPELLANLLLLTFAGLAQLAPGIACALPERPVVGKASVLFGLIAGVTVVTALTFLKVRPANIDPGIIGLAINLVVLGIAHAVTTVLGSVKVRTAAAR